MKLVTDPDLLAQLNSDDVPEVSAPADNPGTLVTDPKLLAQLNDEPPPDNRSTFKKGVDYASSLGNSAQNYLQYLNDSVAKGAKKAILAPAQFLNPFVDVVAGTKFTEGANKLGSDINEKYNQKYPDAGIAGQTLSDVSELLPGMLLGGNYVKGATEGAKGLNYLWGLAKGGIVGGAASAPFIYDESGTASPLKKTVDGMIAGAISAPALGLGLKTTGIVGDGLKDMGRKMIAPESSAANALMGDIANSKQTLLRKEAGDKLGLNLTPAEASGSNLAARAQADLGYTREGAQKLERQEVLRGKQEQNMIEDLLTDISSKPKVVSGEVRDIARQVQNFHTNALNTQELKSINGFMGGLNQRDNVGDSIRETASNIIAKKRAERAAKAEPLYEQAKKETVDQKALMKLMEEDGTIENAVKGVLSDPAYKMELKGYAPNSIKVLDLAKRRIDGQIESSLSPLSPNRERARVLGNSKNRLVDATDEFSPTYAQARRIFAGESEPINDLEGSILGKISKMDNLQLNNIGKTVFNPKETNLNVLTNFKNEIMKEDPEIWKSLVKNEIQRKIDSSKLPLNGESFYNNVLAKPHDYKQLSEAVKGFPDLEKQLSDMRTNFSKSGNIRKRIESTTMARLANMKNPALKQVSSTIFDPNQTDIKSFREIRDIISDNNPQVWKNLIRSEMEKRMSKVDLNSGTAFYKKILQNKNDFNQFMEGTKGMPKVQEKLKLMREVLPNVFNAKTVKAAKGSQENHMSSFRSSTEAVAKFALKHLAKQYDQIAIDMALSGKWNDKLEKVANIKNKDAQATRLQNLIREAMPSKLTENVAGAGIAPIAKNLNDISPW